MKQTVIQFSLTIIVAKRRRRRQRNKLFEDLCTFLNNMWLFVCQKIGSCNKTRWFDDFFGVLLYGMSCTCTHTHTDDNTYHFLYLYSKLWLLFVLLLFYGVLVAYFCLLLDKRMHAATYTQNVFQQKENGEKLQKKYLAISKNEILKGIITTVAESITWNTSICRKYRKGK